MSAGDQQNSKGRRHLSCSECRWRTPLCLDDFHINAQCHSPKNKTIKVSPVTHTEYPDTKPSSVKILVVMNDSAT